MTEQDDKRYESIFDMYNGVNSEARAAITLDAMNESLKRNANAR